MEKIAYGNQSKKGLDSTWKIPSRIEMDLDGLKQNMLCRNILPYICTVPVDWPSTWVKLWCTALASKSTPTGNKNIPLPFISWKKIYFPKSTRVLHGGWDSVCSEGTPDQKIWWHLFRKCLAHRLNNKYHNFHFINFIIAFTSSTRA